MLQIYNRSFAGGCEWVVLCVRGRAHVSLCVDGVGVIILQANIIEREISICTRLRKYKEVEN